MSTPAYPPSAYAMPARRHPLSNNAVNHPNQPVEQYPKQVQQEAVKAPGEPPLPRQNSKTAPPSPPRIISDKSGNIQLRRLHFLGEGGFARVYGVKDARGTKFACKVVTKSSLKTKKAKTKLYAEIKIHRSLFHPNIVHFHDCFEDDANVYMTLELCPHGSMMDMLRQRRRFTEPEARFFMVQLLGACHYMHTHQVIHRDLKLGNLFLDGHMNIKVGDFGLAALIENPGERKKTICGTPNYIAPEVLFDTVNGHSFEVDTWSIGVILYTLVVGRPPFQTKEKDVKTIYKRIRDNEYEFPTTHIISPDSKDLIQQILTPDPTQRPTLHEILDHSFFISGCVPAFIPISAQEFPPDFSAVTRSQSKSNLARLRSESGLDDEPELDESVEENVASKAAKSVTSTVAQQEKEFQKAVQPGSPISALLSSARQPLVMAHAGSTPAFSQGSRGESPLFRKLQAAQRETRRTGLGDIAEEGAAAAAEDKGRDIRRRELESQKARIVAQMADNDADYVRQRGGEREVDTENVPPVPKKEREVRREKEVIDQGKMKEKQATASLPVPALKVDAFETAAETLNFAFQCKLAGKVFPETREERDLPEERIFIASWVDYSNKYGMGYAMADGSVGVYFNDSTNIVLSADKQHFDYVSARKQGSVYVRKSYTVASYPDEIKNKVHLLKYFERYIMDTLHGEYEYTYQDLERTKGMVWVQKYLRMKRVIVFKLSHQVLQFNFDDHTKVILSSGGLLITLIDEHSKLTRWTLRELMTWSIRHGNGRAANSEAKFINRLVEKLEYCKEVLVSIRTASSGTPPDMVSNLGSGNSKVATA